MFVHYRTLGLIFKKENQGEADQLFSIYTKDFGRLEILGRAIRKISSKLRSGAEIFYLSEIEFIQGKTYKTLTDAILIENFLDIRKNLLRSAVAYQIAGVLDDLVRGEEKDEKIWQLLLETFEKLNTLKIRNPAPETSFRCGTGPAPSFAPVLGLKLEILYYYFFWNLVSVLGYQPELQKNSLAGKKIAPDLAKILKLIFKKDWSILARLKIEPHHLKLLKNVSEWYNKTSI